MKKFFTQKFYRIALWWWKWWSYTYRFFFNFKYRNIRVKNNRFATDVNEDLKKLVYTLDGPKQLWDACSSPKWVQHCLDVYYPGKPQPKGPMDCDEFSVYAANAMATDYNPHMMTIAYIKPGGKLSGHAICVYMEGKYLDGAAKLYHTSNWGRRGPFVDLGEVVKSVTFEMGSELVAWSLLDKKLNHIKHGTTWPKGLKL